MFVADEEMATGKGDRGGSGGLVPGDSGVLALVLRGVVALPLLAWVLLLLLLLLLCAWVQLAAYQLSKGDRPPLRLFKARI